LQLQAITYTRQKKHPLKILTPEVYGLGIPLKHLFISSLFFADKKKKHSLKSTKKNSQKSSPQDSKIKTYATKKTLPHKNHPKIFYSST